MLSSFIFSREFTLSASNFICAGPAPAPTSRLCNGHKVLGSDMVIVAADTMCWMLIVSPSYFKEMHCVPVLHSKNFSLDFVRKWRKRRSQHNKTEKPTTFSTLLCLYKGQHNLGVAGGGGRGRGEGQGTGGRPLSYLALSVISTVTVTVISHAD